ncbi:hypothetical protein SK128_000063, partial [Halocaridina rubra]
MFPFSFSLHGWVGGDRVASWPLVRLRKNGASPSEEPAMWKPATQQSGGWCNYALERD